MDRRIFKYPLEVTDVLNVTMPAGAKILSVAEQDHSGIVLWAEVDISAPKVRRRFVIVGTGHPMLAVPADAVFVGTVQTFGGRLVWHVYDGGEVGL